MVRVKIGIPCRDGMLAGGILDGLTIAGNVPADLTRGDSTLLCYNFNRLYAEALNERKNGITHWLLWHNDVEPKTPGWLEIMLREMEAHKLRALCPVIPIKDHQGLTSTGADMMGMKVDHAWPTRRITMTEAHELPVTFTAKDLGPLYQRWSCPLTPKLLLNTGLLLLDIREGWPDGLYFTNQDTVRLVNGIWEANAEPEDWNFSRRLNELGVPLGATRTIVVHHLGAEKYSNDSAWGSCKTDPAFAALSFNHVESISPQ